MNWTLVGHMLFNIGYMTLFWGAFEFAFQTGVPIWSGTLGFPIPHHYLIGAVVGYVGYLLITFNKENRERVRKVLRI